MTAAPSSPVDTQTADLQLEELPEAECRLLLNLGTVGRIAFMAEGLPVVLPVNYRTVSDEYGLRIILRTRPGRLIDRAPKEVAFEIDGVDHERQRGWSVLVRGALHHLDANDSEQLSDRFDPKPWPRQERTSWLAIRPQTMTGRRLQAAEHEWDLPSEAYL
jgi:nitroimidazol reductase NimA-like FMN-containing flavoprotein (pyridoxamine 5'-phosphate oxidase superfamily)